MSPGYHLSPGEEQIRTAQLAVGPGRQAGQLALDVLQHASVTATAWPRGVRSVPAAGSLLSGSAGASPEATLRAWLHPHEQAPATEEVQRFRASLEEALLALQWQELALENGYVPLAEVQENLYAQLRALLGSAAVQQYVLDRNYQLIWRLVRRVGLAETITARNPALVALLSQTPAPRVEAGGQVRFASFLSQYRLWREDAAITVFRQLCNEQPSSDALAALLPQELLAFLREGSVRWLQSQSSESPSTASVEKALGTEALLLQAADGLVGFVQGLSNVRQVFAGADSAGLALFFTSWLAAFFGYRLHGADARRTSTDWSQEPVPPQLLFYLTTGTFADTSDAHSLRQVEQLAIRYQERLAAVQALWAVAQQAGGLRLSEDSA